LKSRSLRLFRTIFAVTFSLSEKVQLVTFSTGNDLEGAVFYPVICFLFGSGPGKFNAFGEKDVRLTGNEILP